MLGNRTTTAGRGGSGPARAWPGNGVRRRCGVSSRWDIGELAELEREIWKGLGTAVRRPKDPWRTPVLTTRADGDARVLVLRAVESGVRELEFHSDARAPKVAALQRDPGVTWVFYSARWQVQLRIRASARVHVGDAEAAAAWERVPESSRINYPAGPAPGTIRSGPGEAQDFREGMLAHFARVRTSVERIDWLWLRPGGHRRATWEMVDGEWTGAWRVP